MQTNDSNERDFVFKNYSSDSLSDLDLVGIDRTKRLDPHKYFTRKLKDESSDIPREVHSPQRSRSSAKSPFGKNDGQNKNQFNHNSKKDSAICSCKKHNEVSTCGKETNSDIKGNSNRFSKGNIDYKKLYAEAMGTNPTSTKKITGTTPYVETVQKKVPVYSVHIDSNGADRKSTNNRTSKTKNIPLCLCNPRNRANFKGKPPGKGVQCPFYRAMSLSQEERTSVHSLRPMQASIHEALRRSTLGFIDPRFSAGHPLLAESITQTDPIPMEDKQVDAYISDDESVMYMQQMQGDEIVKWKCKPVKDDGIMCPGSCCQNGCGNNFDDPYWCGPDLNLMDNIDWVPCCCVQVRDGQECPGMEDPIPLRDASVRSDGNTPEPSTPKSKKKDKRKKSPVKEKHSVGTSYTKLEDDPLKKKAFPRQVFLHDRKERRQSDSAVLKIFKQRRKIPHSDESSSLQFKESSSPPSTPSKSRLRFRPRVKSVAYQTDPDHLLGRAFRRALQRQELEEVSPPARDTLRGKITLKETGCRKKKCDDIYSSFECRNREVTPESDLILKDILKKGSAHNKSQKEKPKKHKKRGKFMIGSESAGHGGTRNSPTTKLRIISFSADSTEPPEPHLKSGDVPQVSSSGCAGFPNKREYGIKKMKLNKSCRSAYVLVKRKK